MMDRPRPWRSLLLSLCLCCAVFVARRQFHIFAWSGAVDWLMLVLCAAVAPLMHRDRSLLYRAGLFLVAAIAGIGATILLVLFLYQDFL
jgi:hypothetical protein